MRLTNGENRVHATRGAAGSFAISASASVASSASVSAARGGADAVEDVPSGEPCVVAKDAKWMLELRGRANDCKLRNQLYELVILSK